MNQPKQAHSSGRAASPGRLYGGLLILLQTLFLPGLVLGGASHDYSVTVLEDLDHVEVEARLDAEDMRLSAPRGRLRRLEHFAACEAGRVSGVGDSLRVIGGCVRYRAFIRPSKQTLSSYRRPPTFAGHESWLWLPMLRGDDVVRLRLTVPSGTHAVVPWRLVGDGRYELRASPGSGDAIAWFGPATTRQIVVLDAKLSLTLLPGEKGGPLNLFVVKPWLEEAAGLVGSVGGRFPNSHVQVLVEPGESAFFGDSPVPFGHVIRSGEEVVRFFVKPQATTKALREDWTAVHEFAHLLLPYVRDDQKWISEGFASYYQNVLLARGGIYSEREAWQRLVRSFAQADKSTRPTSPNDAHMRSFWDVRMLIYWSGAAIALMGDVELRRVSNGEESLDTVLSKLASCCLPSARVWDGRELFTKLDELSGHGVFMPLYDKHANAPGMPPYQSLLEALGVKPKDKSVNLDGTAPLSQIREAIMRERKTPPVARGVIR